jgi:hypothetical protein
MNEEKINDEYKNKKIIDWNIQDICEWIDNIRVWVK